jgi:hypothetical protein
VRNPLPAIVLVGALAGCGGNSGYDKNLVEQLGKGSTTLNAVVTNFTPPDVGRQLTVPADLSKRELDRMTAVQRRTTRLSEHVVAKFHRLARQAGLATVDLSVHGVEASGEVRRFVKTYNDIAERVRTDALGAAAGFEPALTSNRSNGLVLAEYAEYLATGDTSGLEAARRDARRKLQAASKRTFDQRALEDRLESELTRLADQADDSSDVAELVRDVKSRYPDSVLNHR